MTLFAAPPPIALACGMLALTLAGCAVGPDFQVPTPPPVDRYAAGPAPAATVAADAAHGHPQTLAAGMDVPAQWWTLFRSPELDRAIRTALAASPTLAQAQARLRQAQENLAAATGATRWPAVDARLDAARQQINIESLGIRAFPSPGPFTLYGASVQVSYTLDLFGGNRRELEGLQAAVDYQRFELEAARLSLAANVATAAIGEAGLRARLADTTALADAQRHQLAIAEERLRAGGVPALDVQRQRGELAQTEALLPELSRQLAATRHQLAVYLGEPPSAAEDAARVPAFALNRLHLPETLPLALPSTLAQRRPDIRAAEALLHRASADIGVATANLYPRLTLSASAGSQASTVREVFDSFNVWSLAAGLVQPVFRGGELQARKRAAEAAYEQSLAAYRQAVLGGLQQVGDTLRALQADADVLRARADAEQAARATLATVSEQYRLGGVSQYAALDAQRQYRQASLALTQATVSRFADSAALLQALGGGWWQEAEVSASGR
ncbi:efflux transporter outer membrane subunit [Cupriavidus respiraculi]|uniref:Efflux pump outer membrane protein TtgC n=1 Tax=Cupriavidus respiraculi TaxID=195930 RepID=A0ABM8X510_9BURK|nr:efflux transporter outer membrane subunit [Cupriavidus respiraculi]CAG9175016.1 putative efflux pump outer membrane protein TtgC [Cupriavidus respiraculi]